MIKRLNAALALVVVSLITFPFNGLAWNIPGHMLSGAIAYQILQRENPATIATVRSTLDKNPWYESHWRAQLEKLPDTERDEMLFMLAARWAHDMPSGRIKSDTPLSRFTTLTAFCAVENIGFH